MRNWIARRLPWYDADAARARHDATAEVVAEASRAVRRSELARRSYRLAGERWSGQ